MRNILFLIIGAVLFLILIVPNSRAELNGSGSESKPNSLEGSSVPPVGTINTKSSYLIYRVGSGASLPMNVTMLTSGEIVNVDRDQDIVSIRDPQTGHVSTFPVTDRSSLNGLNPGDKVQVFSRAEPSR